MKPAHLAPLVSESLPPQSWSRRDIFKLIHEAERVLSPIALQSGAYYHPQGAYQVFETPGGARIGIWAPDPDDLATEDMVVTEEQAKGLYRWNAQGEKIPLAAGDKLPRRLKDLGNGNLKRLRIFTIKPGYRSEKWLTEEMNKHQSAFRAFTLEQGILIREKPDRWTSGGIVYQLVRHEREMKNGQAYNHSPGPDDKCYDLLMTVAPGHGWQLSQKFDELFQKGTLTNKFMCAGSMRAKDISMNEAEHMIVRDFEKRAPLFIDGLSPYQVVFSLHNPYTSRLLRYKLARRILRTKPMRKTRELWRHYRPRNLVLYFMYGKSRLSNKEIAKTAGIIAISALGLGAVFNYLGTDFNPMVAAGRVTGRTLTKASERIKQYTEMREMELDEPGVEELYNAYALNWNPRQVWGAKFNPARLMELEALDHDHLNTDFNYFSRTMPKLMRDMTVKNYIFSVLQGPPGSHAEPFMIGKYGAIRVDEPNGFSVEHVVERSATFARLDKTKLRRAALPDAVIAMFEEHPGKPYIKVGFNPHKGLFLQMMTKEEYLQNIEVIARAEYPPPHRRPDPNKIRLAPREPEPKKHSWLHGQIKKYFGESVATTVRDAVEDVAEKYPAEHMHELMKAISHLRH